jgi:hypothetical protein
MLGFGQSRKPQADRLPVLVEVIQNRHTFTMAQKVWDLNVRYVRHGAANHKEFLRFGLVGSKQAVWLERDAGRKDAFELILTWWEDGTQFADIYALIPSMGAGSSGDDTYAKQVLDALLTAPATLPVDKPE